METTPTTKRAGGEKRGNATDRRRSRANLLRHFGDGTTCDCAYCGTTLRENPGGPDHVERDRIVAGGPYTMTNLLPACRTCNLARLDKDILTFAAEIGRTEAIARLIDHAAAYRRRR